MAKKKRSKPASAFDELGFRETVAALTQEVSALYRADAIPWVVGYSGGKDSTAVLQLVWGAIASLPEQDRAKPVYVISTDTLVENPVVAAWVSASLRRINQAAQEQGLPLEAHRLTPKIKNTFWVNLIGKGYPAPRHKFRWCTERLKISPSNAFIRRVVKQNGEAILVLGTRKAESTKRAAVMKKLEAKRIRDRLSPNASLPNSLVYSPIENWRDDDVWLYLMQVKNYWGIDHKDLLTMYQGASADGECPLVLDKSTPSCGDSRFGCWVCTMVDQDRSMQAMIQNDQEKEWMLPLLEFRNSLANKNDRHLRDFRRITGSVQLFHDRPIPGPYKQDVREDLLRRLLEIQLWVRKEAPAEIRDLLELVSLPELQEIRRIWVMEKHELEDRLPKIYEEVLGEPFPLRMDDNRVFGAEEMELLEAVCEGDRLQYELIRELLDVEWRARTQVRRSGLFQELERAFRRNFYRDEEDAVGRERERRRRLEAARLLREPEANPEAALEQLTLDFSRPLPVAEVNE